MNFSTKSVTVEATGTGSKYLAVGINEGVTLSDFSSGEAKSGTPFLEVTISKGDDSSVKDKLYFSDKAQESSQKRAIELLTAAGVERTAIDDAGEKATTLDDYAKKLTGLIPKGNSFRMKFAGEEYNASGTIKVAKRIPFQDFAEPTATSPSGLKYSEKYDLKKMPVPNDGDVAVATNNTGDDSELPF